jgi:hypothetical protein
MKVDVEYAHVVHKSDLQSRPYGCGVKSGADLVIHFVVRVADGMKAVSQYDQIVQRITEAGGNEADPLTRVRVGTLQITHDCLSQRF